MLLPSLVVKPTGILLAPDPERVLIQPFFPASEAQATKVVARVMALGAGQVHRLLEQVISDFEDRHAHLEAYFENRFEQIRHLLPTDEEPPRERRRLMASYFTSEYALESAALFNPSIVSHPDQSGLAPGQVRFVLSLRSTGEGHISSITFRTGVIDADHQIHLDPPGRFVTQPERIADRAYESRLFRHKLFELDLLDDFARQLMDSLGEQFTLPELRQRLTEHQRAARGEGHHMDEVAQGILHLALSNYTIRFQPEQPLAELAIFPASPSQSNGIEDARFVLFHEEDGSQKYYATFSAYDGQVVVPELLETEDFCMFKMITLNGPAVQNKGMALFPRRINGLYAMLSRQDNENIYLMFSENIHFWYDAQVIVRPTYDWEYVQVGNCGSPIETERGWLVLSHGIGPMRKYCIGAFLLDRDDPGRVIGRLREPLIQPDEKGREGYVPNVVYTCGAILHERELIIPYALSDHATTFATVSVDELLDRIEADRD